MKGEYRAIGNDWVLDRGLSEAAAAKHGWRQSKAKHELQRQSTGGSDNAATQHIGSGHSTEAEDSNRGSAQWCAAQHNLI